MKKYYITIKHGPDAYSGTIYALNLREAERVCENNAMFDWTLDGEAVD